MSGGLATRWPVVVALVPCCVTEAGDGRFNPRFDLFSFRDLDLW